MSVVLTNGMAEYHLPLGEEKITLNALLGQKIQLRHTGMIYCIQCGRKTTKSFQQGHCFPCYRKLLECNLCIIHPEKCRFYEGLCKPDDWAHAHCGQPQMIYLANSSGLKVGITRATNLYSRWIDQGATQGLAIFHVQNRYQAGLIEVALKTWVADKTHWQAMLKADNAPMDLAAKREQILAQAKTAISELMLRYPEDIQRVEDNTVTMIKYPILHYPQKITALDFDKTHEITGILHGIKAQYLILDTGVLSVRKFGGYEVEWL